MRNRIISVPKDKKAEEDLGYNQALESQLIELKLSDEEFLFLYHNDIIELINTEGRSNIDDYEDDCVRGNNNLERVISALKDIEKKECSNLINRILNLFIEALNRNTGVYFYF